MWEILEDLERLRQNPYLRELHEEDGEQFILSSGYIVLLDVSSDTITVALRKFGAN